MRLFILALSAACVALYGYALAGYAGNFFGHGRPDYVLWGLLSGTACGAAALFMWKKWLKDTAADLLVFDVDGVLIDANESYMLAAAETVRWCWENLLGGDADCEGYGLEHFKIAKMHPAFNDDSAIAWAVLNIMRRTGRKSMKEAFPSPDAFKSELGMFGSAPITAETLFHGDAQTLSLAEVRVVLEEIYFGTELCAEFKKKTRGLGREGLWKEDTAAISMDWKELGLPVGIYTGRSRDEMTLGYKVLNWRDFPDNMLICSDHGILKPSPEGLKLLCERSGAKCPVFFGDTASDLAAWTAFGKGMFVGIGPVLKAPARRGEFLHFDTLEEALSSLFPRA